MPIVAYTSEDVRHGTAMFHRCMQSGFNDVVVRRRGGPAAGRMHAWRQPWVHCLLCAGQVAGLPQLRSQRPNTPSCPLQPKPVNRRHAVELLSRWLPGLKPGSPRGSDASSDDEVRCSCSTAGCSKCTQAGNGTAASTTSAQQGISSGSGSGASAQAGGDDAGSTAGGAGGSSASSVRRWPPGWQG